MIFLVLLIGAAAVVFAWTLLERAGYMQFPFYFVAVYFGWALPQLIALRGDPFLPDGSLDRVAVMALLSLLATVAGWWWPIHHAPGVLERDVAYSVPRLFRATLALSLFGALVQHAMSWVEVDPSAANGQWTGPITILAMLAQSTLPAFAISLMLWLRLRTLKTFLLVAFNAFVYAPNLFIFARRSDLVAATLVVLMSLWFIRRILVPRAAIVLVLVVGSLVVNSIGAIRSRSYGIDELGHVYVKDRSWSDIASIDFLGNLPLFDYEKAKELETAAFTMEAIVHRGAYDLGAGVWNAFVLRYVPGQIIGFDRKRQLMLGDPTGDATLDETGYVVAIGSTETGFTDAFRAFWYFGALLFFANARILRHLYERALRGRLWAQTLYMCLMTFAMQTVTHSCANMLVAAPAMLAFTSVVFLLARRRPAAPGMRVAASTSAPAAHRRTPPVAVAEAGRNARFLRPGVPGP